MQIHVTLLLDDGRRESLGPGAVIGRMVQATLRIDDPRISEAHALVSLRGAELKLLSLRGRLSVDGKPKTEVTLTPGLRITLAGFFRLTVESVALPDDILAVSTQDGLDEIVGAHGVVALFPGSASVLRSGYDPAAAAHVWTRAGESVLRRATDPEATAIDQRLTPGDTFEVGGALFRFVRVSRRALEARPTSDRGRDETRLKLVLRFDSVHIFGADGRSAVIDGIAARLICELHEIGAPIGWFEVSRLLWPTDGLTPTVVRQRWDQLLTRLRMRLREAGLRSDLVRPSQRGLVELQLGPEDQIVDET